MSENRNPTPRPESDSPAERPRLDLPIHLIVREGRDAYDAETGPGRARLVELIFVAGGRGTIVCGNSQLDIGPRDVLVIPPETRYRCSPAPDLSLICVRFDPQKLPLPKLDLPLLPGYHTLFVIRAEKSSGGVPPPKFTLTASQYDGISALLRMMLGEYRHRRPGANFRLLGLFMALLGNLAAIYSDTSHAKQREATDQLGALVAYMNSNFHRRLGYDELLRQVHMSRSTLNRNFIRATGEPPMRYLLNLRLGHAVKLLSLTNMSITEVAVASGFEDSNYFSRVFRKVYHISPRGYRAMPLPVLDC